MYYFMIYFENIYVCGKFFENKFQIWMKFIHNFTGILSIKLYQPFLKNLI